MSPSNALWGVALWATLSCVANTQAQTVRAAQEGLDQSAADPALSLPEVSEEEILHLTVGDTLLFTAEHPVSGVMTADPTIVDIQPLDPLSAVVLGIAPGRTTAYIWHEEDGGTAYRRLDVHVHLELDDIRTELEALLPGAEILVKESPSGVLVEGRLRSLEQSVHLKEYLADRDWGSLNTTTVADIHQVQVRVRIAEVGREAARALGVNGVAANSNGFLGSVLGPGGSPLNPISIGVPQGGSALGNAPFQFTSDLVVNPAVTLFGGLQGDLELFIQALAENRYLRILAEPNLVARSGEDASFLAGGEFPIPIAQSGGGQNGAISVEFKEFGVGLQFRPIVSGDGMIELQLLAEVSDITDIGAVETAGVQVPAITARRIQTTVELYSGQTLAMGGLLRETVRATVSSTPGLASIPIIGQLFRSVRYIRGETELVILVTASLIAPTSEIVDLPLPGEEHQPPTDWELYLSGELQGQTSMVPSASLTRGLKALGLNDLTGPGAWAVHGPDFEGQPR